MVEVAYKRKWISVDALASLSVEIEETKILHNLIVCIVQQAGNYINIINARETTSRETYGNTQI